MRPFLFGLSFLLHSQQSWAQSDDTSTTTASSSSTTTTTSSSSTAASSAPTIATLCTQYLTPSIVCVIDRAAVLPPPFYRQSAVDAQAPLHDDFLDTSVPSAPSFGLITNATFIVFDEERANLIIGPNAPTIEFMFTPDIETYITAPVYVPSLNSIIYSIFAVGVYTQRIINLNDDPPTTSTYTTNPPIYGVTTAVLNNGTIYWSVAGGHDFPSPVDGSTVHQPPGIYILDPATGSVTPLVNNYYGQYLNGPQAVWVDNRGDVWFTDPFYGYYFGLTPVPILTANTYRFRPSNGLLNVVDTSLVMPAALYGTPDGSTIYISDTAIVGIHYNPSTDSVQYFFDPQQTRSVFAFDTVGSNNGYYVNNKRPIFLSQTWAESSMIVSREGYIVGTAGEGVDILDPFGALLMRIQVEPGVSGVQFAGPNLDELWVFGPPGIYRITGMTGIKGVSGDA